MTSHVTRPASGKSACKARVQRPGYDVPVIALGLVVLVAVCVIVAFVQGKD
ncbi:MAG TPA: hypothetical protein VE132_15885 [Micromonosporaceae bacterium]|nr:hypothetical protein [Micromonosporaceae bacterium]